MHRGLPGASHCFENFNRSFIKSAAEGEHARQTSTNQCECGGLGGGGNNETIKQGSTDWIAWKSPIEIALNRAYEHLAIRPDRPVESRIEGRSAGIENMILTRNSPRRGKAAGSRPQGHSRFRCASKMLLLRSQTRRQSRPHHQGLSRSRRKSVRFANQESQS